MRTHNVDYLIVKAETVRGIEATGAFTPLYFVVDGELEVNENLQVETGIGGVMRYYRVVEAGGSTTLLVVPSAKPFLQDARRASYPAGTLKSWTIEGGTADFGIKLFGASVEELSLEGRAGEALRASLRFDAMGGVATTGASQAPTTESPIDWAASNAIIAGANYQLASFRASLRNNIKYEADFSVRDVNRRRWRNLFALGTEQVEASFEIYLPYGASLSADTIAAIAAQIVFGSPAALTLDFTSLMVARRRMPVKGGDDLWVFTLETIGRPGSLTIT